MTVLLCIGSFLLGLIGGMAIASPYIERWQSLANRSIEQSQMLLKLVEEYRTMDYAKRDGCDTAATDATGTDGPHEADE